MPDVRPLHAVVFRVGGVVCALPAGVVREILPAIRATRVPGVPAGVEGLVNVRGGLVTVLGGATGPVGAWASATRDPTATAPAAAMKPRRWKPPGDGGLA